MFKEKKKQFQIDVKHIPHGTQIVTMVDKVLKDYKYKTGRTGVIIDSNFDNNTYTIRFSDNAEVEYERREITIRKIEIENFIQTFAPEPKQLKENIIYECLTGSRAFGLATESSDDDIRGIYLAPPEVHLSLWGAPEQLEDKQADIVYWELEKFLRLALKANPNVLETLWSPLIKISTPLSSELLEMRESFLSRHIFKTYGGYAISQFEKMKKDFQKAGKFKTKHALHLIRLLLSGTTALKEGYIMVDASHYRSQLLSIKEGQMSFEEIQQWRKELEIEFNQAYESTKLPELPDVKKANQFLLKARQH
jgi:predicted nucleotidyltransferase